MFAPTSFTDTLLSFSSLPFDTGLTLAWETRLRGQENALWYLQHLIFAGGMALVLTLRASAASWLNLALLSKVLIHMKSFTFLLPWKWGEDQDFNYFSGMSDSNQWHFLRVSSSLPDLMLIRAAFIQSLVMKLHLTQLFQMVSVKRDSYQVGWSGAGLHWHASYLSSKSIHIFYCNSMKFILQLFFPKNGAWKVLCWRNHLLISLPEMRVKEGILKWRFGRANMSRLMSSKALAFHVVAEEMRWMRESLWVFLVCVTFGV